MLRLLVIVLATFLGASIVGSKPFEDTFTNLHAAGSTIPYFSAAGQAYAKKHRLPAPPFRRRKLNSVDPPRSVPAASWNGPFCEEWTDECTTCRRMPKGTPACKPVADIEGDSCQRHAVTCTKLRPGDEDGFRFCRTIELHQLTRLPGKTEEDFTKAYSDSGWYYARRDRRWHMWLAEESILPARRPPPVFGQPYVPLPPSPKLEYQARDERCMHSIGELQGRSDFFASDPLIER